AELEIQTAAITQKYDREISLAEGNNYKVKRLEKQKEKEIAKAKNEANKKMFAMQVIQAVAQTATNAINAYGSAAAIPVVGFVMAPIAAAMAVAAGMLQVAAIKKQQQASEAQGYAAGGFTPEGAADEPVGIVHAGEWVASQKLVKNPATRPLLEALDYAQRTNSIGSLSSSDVSQSITAPSVLAQSAIRSQSVPQQVIVQNTPPASDNGLTDTIKLLRDRLDEPFLTVNSVTGETGMKQAQDEYDRLMRNKTPKSRRS
ncbi:MAG: phage tail tape measure protein, partial [Bacteroidaceae bacterium]|nr:phage tail tape measure protein [Bacteroidaceae bacterium]